jgi:hypothetical protein
MYNTQVFYVKKKYSSLIFFNEFSFETQNAKCWLVKNCSLICDPTYQMFM